jgi:hypothetical protein
MYFHFKRRLTYFGHNMFAASMIDITSVPAEVIDNAVYLNGSVSITTYSFISIEMYLTDLQTNPQIPTCITV